jgi:O-antigen/teichoic acid export membrane protein
MSIGIKTLNSSVIILMTRVAQRSIGIVSMLVLARLLSPEDFGIVAIASMIVFFFDVLTESGTRQYIVQKEAVDRDDLDTAWTLNLLLKLVVGVVFFSITPLLADYFEKPQLEAALKVIALILPIGALQSPGLIMLSKELNYRPIMRLLVTEKVFSAAITVAIAYYLQSYWAMIIGVVFSYTFKSIGSYFIYHYWPKFNLSRIREQWAFSQWILLKGTLGYSKSEFDTFMISKLFSFDDVGGFNMMKNISSIPAREIIIPLSEPLLASFAIAKSSPERLQFQITTSICILLLGTAPITAYLFSYHQTVVSLLFDERWWGYSPILGVLSLLIINFSIISVFHEALVAVGKVKLLFYYDLITFSLIIGVLISLSFADSVEFAIARTAVALVSMLILTLVVIYVLKINALTLLSLSGLIGFAAVCSVILSKVIYHVNGEALTDLLISGILFVMSYILILIAIYWVFRRTNAVKGVADFLIDLYSQVMHARITKRRNKDKTQLR